MCVYTHTHLELRTILVDIFVFFFFFFFMQSIFLNCGITFSVLFDIMLRVT